MASLVVDAQPLVAIMAGEPAAAEATAALRRYRASGDVVISAVNWCEVLYVCRALLGVRLTVRAIAAVQRFPIHVVDADAALASMAAELKVRHRLGLGDSFAAALAYSTRAPLLTGDVDFLALEGHGLAIEWVGERS